MHINQRIRETVRDLLEGAPGLAAVYTSRSQDLTRSDLPAAVIGTGTDTVEGATKDGLERREITLTIVVVADGEQETLDDGLDEIRAQIERRVAGGLDDLAVGVEHTGADLDMGTDEDGDRWFAFYALSWRVTVFTQQGEPDEDPS